MNCHQRTLSCKSIILKNWENQNNRSKQNELRHKVIDIYQSLVVVQKAILLNFWLLLFISRLELWNFKKQTEQKQTNFEKVKKAHQRRSKNVLGFLKKVKEPAKR